MSSKDPEPKQSPDRETLNSPESKQLPEEAPNEVSAEEEEGECEFCVFMKGGGCRDSFVGWEKCIKEAEENKESITRKCFEATSALMECMQAHADYYDPLLRAEEEARKELQKEKEMEDSASHQDSNNK